MSRHPRKRSRSATLVLMVPAATLLVAACSDQQPAQVPAVVYRDATECTQQHPDQAAQCQADYDQAKAQHPQVAPRYLSRAECEADFGYDRCETSPYQHSGGSFFMPMMMGYMAGQMFNRPQVVVANPQQQYDDRNGGSTGGGSIRGAGGFVPTQPLYKSRDDSSTYRTAGNEAVSTRSGTVSIDPDSVRAANAGRVTRSGGFGSTAARVSSFSG